MVIASLVLWRHAVGQGGGVEENERAGARTSLAAWCRAGFFTVYIEEAVLEKGVRPNVSIRRSVASLKKLKLCTMSRCRFVQVVA